MKDIYWIQHSDAPQLAIVARPRGDDWLEDDLAKLKRNGIDVLVSLLTQQESDELGLHAEEQLAHRLGIAFSCYPIPDRTVPQTTNAFRKFISGLANDIRAGKHIGIHCRGSIGRATITAAAILRDLGYENAAALLLIEQARGCIVPDTEEQRRWILAFRAES